MAKLREDSVTNWLSALDDGMEYRRKYGRESEWAKCEAMFQQAHTTQAEALGPNIIMSTGDALLSSLHVPNPQYLLDPLQASVVDATPILERTLNVLLYATKLRGSMENGGLNAFLFGKGILKLGYDSEFGYDPNLDLGQRVKQVFGLSTTQFAKDGSK